MKCSDCKFTDRVYSHTGEVSTIYEICTLTLPPWVQIHEGKVGTRQVRIYEYATDECDLGVKKEENNG